MRIQFKYHRFIFATAIFIALVSLFTQCINGKQAEEKPSPVVDETGYAGNDKCMSCHQTAYEQHLHSAHQLTSLPADEKNINGSFKNGENVFAYRPTLNVAMEKRDSGLFQVVYFNNEEKMAMRFGITVGSGTMGQSYIEQRGNRLYQMPVTYFAAAHQWSNSPGFPKDMVMTDRPITARCLECHATYAKGEGGTAMEPADFATDQMILGVGCEKCHGPAAKHVAYHSDHAGDSIAKFVVNPKNLSRQLQLDVCALCHGGKIQKTKPSFSFTAGQKLSDFFAEKIIVEKAMSSGEVEVHGNQYGLLTASSCFKQSTSLTCNSCHAPHGNERGNLALFSSRCIACHDVNSTKFNTVTHAKTKSISQNCIDCHMPQQESKAIAVYLQGADKPVASLIRSHYIGIYSDKKTGQ